MPNISFWVGKVVFLALATLFAIKIASSVSKLLANHIGTSVRTIISDTIRYPSMTLCKYNESVGVIDSETTLDTWHGLDTFGQPLRYDLLVDLMYSENVDG